MVSEMESVKNVTNNSAYLTNPSPPVHSPQSVGVEFVRQYYTMLNRAPHLLFRFYSDDSTFIHGCLDKRGETGSLQHVGQKQINAKIMSLNFKNCRTKIRQVDSMETIGNGVVIQVIGELSNNEQPLRHFLQTFVLTPQSPNKYYVRNDIFRYQDESGLDENEEQPESSDIETKIEENVENSVETSEKDYYQSNGTITSGIAEHVTPIEENVVTKQDEQEPVQDNSLDITNVEEEPIESKEQVANEEEEEVEEDDADESGSEATANQSHYSNEPKTYANMVSKSFQGGTSPNLNSAKPTVNLNVASVANEVVGSVPEIAAPQPIVNNNNKNTGLTPPQRERYVKKSGFNKRNEPRESVKINEEEKEVVDSGEIITDHQLNVNAVSKNQKIFPDDHQLFIGNLLPNFTEEELRSIFARYGTILEVRINRQIHKTNSNKANRNYGFITYENPDVVDQIIAQKPIYHGNHRYNVEKKQGKSNYARNNNNNNNPNINNNNNPRNGGTQPPNTFHNPSIRHMQVNAGPGQGNPGQRSRPGQNYNSTNNPGNRNFVGGQNYANRNNSFNHQQQQQQQQPAANR